MVKTGQKRRCVFRVRFFLVGIVIASPAVYPVHTERLLHRLRLEPVKFGFEFFAFKCKFSHQSGYFCIGLLAFICVVMFIGFTATTFAASVSTIAIATLNKLRLRGWLHRGGYALS